MPIGPGSVLREVLLNLPDLGDPSAFLKVRKQRKPHHPKNNIYSVEKLQEPSMLTIFLDTVNKDM